jgi:hypothetical protein
MGGEAHGGRCIAVIDIGTVGFLASRVRRQAYGSVLFCRYPEDQQPIAAAEYAVETVELSRQSPLASVAYPTIHNGCAERLSAGHEGVALPSGR